MTDGNPDRPTILVGLAPEVDERLYGWISIGAEEEGIPCRRASAEETGEAGEDDAAALAYAAARNSRLGVGVGVVSGRVAVHERHMPAGKPVVTTEVEENKARDRYRSAGSNAARLVIGMPLQLE